LTPTRQSEPTMMHPQWTGRAWSVPFSNKTKKEPPTCNLHMVEVSVETGAPPSGSVRL
jgi:hypothetical protein